MFGDYIFIPPARASFYEEHFNVRDQRREAAHYYALYSYDASWKHLCIGLYRASETAALQIARPHLQTVRGTVVLYRTVRVYMYVPDWSAQVHLHGNFLVHSIILGHIISMMLTLFFLN